MTLDWRSVDPEKLDPTFRRDVEALLESSPFAWTVLYGFRSLAEQEKLWRAYQSGGPRAAPPGKSAHNYGLAVDVVPDGDPNKAGLQPDWNTGHPAWKWLFEAVFRHPRLHSGRSFHDSDHIEAVNWKAVARARLTRGAAVS